MGECVMVGQHCAHMYTHTDIDNFLCHCSHVNCDSVTGQDWGLLAMRRYYNRELILRVRKFKHYFIIWQLLLALKNENWRSILETSELCLGHFKARWGI